MQNQGKLANNDSRCSLANLSGLLISVSIIKSVDNSIIYSTIVEATVCNIGG